VEIIVGVVLAVVVLGFATLVGFDRDRAFYPTVMVVIASYYGLFGVMGGSRDALIAEVAAAGVFVVASVLGFKRSLWIVAAALAAHGVFDYFHGHLIPDPGVPGWWPGFCGTFDVVAAIYLSWLLMRNKGSVPN